MKALGLNEPFQKAAVMVSDLGGGETGSKRTPSVSLPPAMMNEAGGAHWFVLALASSVDSPCPLLLTCTAASTAFCRPILAQLPAEHSGALPLLPPPAPGQS